jgi:hypothetical protein
MFFSKTYREHDNIGGGHRFRRPIDEPAHRWLIAGQFYVALGLLSELATDVREVLGMRHQIGSGTRAGRLEDVSENHGNAARTI